MRGTLPGRFSFPRGIDVASDGRIAVADKTGRIQILSPSGESITEWEMPKMDNGTPTGVLFDTTFGDETTLLVCDTHNSRIMRYTPEGELIAKFGDYGEEPGRMIYPTDLAVDSEGNIYATEYGFTNRVMKFTASGEFIMQWGELGDEPGQFRRAMALVFAPPDRIIVADSCNHRVQVFSTEGELLDIWGEVGQGAGQMSYPYDIALDGEGRLFIAEYGNNRIQCLDPAGRPLAIFGAPGRAPGEFATPWGVALGPGPDPQLYVADTSNHRLQAIEAERVAAGGS